MKGSTCVITKYDLNLIYKSTGYDSISATNVKCIRRNTRVYVFSVIIYNIRIDRFRTV